MKSSRFQKVTVPYESPHTKIFESINNKDLGAFSSHSHRGLSFRLTFVFISSTKIMSPANPIAILYPSLTIGDVAHLEATMIDDNTLFECKSKIFNVVPVIRHMVEVDVS